MRVTQILPFESLRIPSTRPGRSFQITSLSPALEPVRWSRWIWNRGLSVSRLSGIAVS
jgi:hypothetical protein